MDNKRHELEKKQHDNLLSRELRGTFVKEMVSHPGYKAVYEKMNDRISFLEEAIKLSNDPNEVFACIKEKNGLLFFMDTANLMIANGEKATATLLGKS